jgi:ABC-type multidrug transport system fused ATPase/permease subunit
MVNVEREMWTAPRWRVAASLLSGRQRLVFLLLTAARAAVGLLDISVAAAMYWLFRLLQERAPAAPLPWIPRTIFAAALLASILVIIRAAVDMVSSRSAFGWIQRLHMDLLLRLTRGYGDMQWMRFVARNRAELAHHTTCTVREAADFYHRCVEMIAGTATVAAMMVALIYESMSAAVVFAATVAALYGLNRLLVRRLIQRAGSSREVSLNKLQRILSGFFSLAKEVRIHRAQSFFSRRIQREAESWAAHHRRAVFLPQVSRIVADQGVIVLFLGLIMAVAAQRADTSQLLSVLVFYFVLSRRLLPLIGQLSLIAGQMESSYESVRVLEVELGECCECRVPVACAPLPRRGFVLEMNQVSFWYQPDKPLLRGVNFCLRSGEIAVVHGASGLGKTTLLNLIAGILEPVSGQVRVDRGSIACVPQEICLLDDSVRNNLLFGLHPRSDDDLMQALAAASLADFVSSQPAGLDTQIGDNGALLSGGQRQRLGLARAILRGSRLLLLDEATTALDPENERKILANLSASGVAILLVTHQPRVHGFAHRAYRLLNGALQEETEIDTCQAGSAIPSGHRDPVPAAP